MHYVGGLKKNQSADLYEIPNEEYRPLSSKTLKGQTSYRTTKKIFGEEHTIVIVHNPALEEGQMQGIQINGAKATAKLLEIQQKLMRRAKGEVKGGKKPTIIRITKKVERILKPQKVRSFTRGTALAQQVEEIYQLKKMYFGNTR